MGRDDMTIQCPQCGTTIVVPTVGLIYKWGENLGILRCRHCKMDIVIKAVVSYEAMFQEDKKEMRNG